MKFPNLGRQRTFLVLFSKSSDWETMLHDLFQAGVITHAGRGGRLTFFLSFQLKYLTPKIGTHMKLKLLKRCN